MRVRALVRAHVCMPLGGGGRERERRSQCLCVWCVSCVYVVCHRCVCVMSCVCACVYVDLDLLQWNNSWLILINTTES